MSGLLVLSLYIPSSTLAFTPTEQANIRAFVEQNLGNETAIRTAMHQNKVSYSDIYDAYASVARQKVVNDFVKQNIASPDEVARTALQFRSYGINVSDTEIALAYLANGRPDVSVSRVAGYIVAYKEKQVAAVAPIFTPTASSTGSTSASSTGSTSTTSTGQISPLDQPLSSAHSSVTLRQAAEWIKTRMTQGIAPGKIIADAKQAGYSVAEIGLAARVTYPNVTDQSLQDAYDRYVKSQTITESIYKDGITYGSGADWVESEVKKWTGPAKIVREARKAGFSDSQILDAIQLKYPAFTQQMFTDAASKDIVWNSDHSLKITTSSYEVGNFTVYPVYNSTDNKRWYASISIGSGKMLANFLVKNVSSSVQCSDESLFVNISPSGYIPLNLRTDSGSLADIPNDRSKKLPNFCLNPGASTNIRIYGDVPSVPTNSLGTVDVTLDGGDIEGQNWKESTTFRTQVSDILQSANGSTITLSDAGVWLQNRLTELSASGITGTGAIEIIVNEVENTYRYNIIDLARAAQENGVSVPDVMNVFVKHTLAKKEASMSAKGYTNAQKFAEYRKLGRAIASLSAKITSDQEGTPKAQLIRQMEAEINLYKVRLRK